jgi:ATP:corrinoid adenosyltransferase
MSRRHDCLIIAQQSAAKGNTIIFQNSDRGKRTIAVGTAGENCRHGLVGH